MAKKTIASPTTATQKTSKSRTEKKESIKCAMRFFWDFADLVWENAGAHQERLATSMPLITREYIALQVAEIARVKALPNNTVRTAKKKKSRLSLSGHRQAVMTQVNLLDNAINVTYQQQAELIPVELNEAGITTLRSATVRDWAAVSTFLTSSAAYLTESGQKLVDAKTIPADFAANLETLGEEFNAAKTGYTSQRQTAKDGTQSVAKGIKDIKAAISIVLTLGKDVFEFEPELRKLFTEKIILAEVRSTHPANIDGRTDLGPVVEGFKPKPLAGILVEVLGQEGKVATTNKKGRYKIPIAGGEYRMRFSGADLVPVELNVTVQPGVDRRINMVMLPMEVVSREITPPSSTMNEALTDALKEVSNIPADSEIRH